MGPVHVLIKPASGNCNMCCDYCFYKDELQHRETPDCGVMSGEHLDRIIRSVLAEARGSCSFTFQGGEPTLAGLEYYRQVIAAVERHNVHGCQIHYGIQTNGLGLDEAWCRFLKAHQFLVGVSLDGYQELHDRYRRDRAGRGTYERVMKSLALLNEYQVPFNILTVVHRETAMNINKVYNFFKRSGFAFQQYIECLDPIGETAASREYSLTPELYSGFLKALFRKWYRDMAAGRYVYNRYFENLLLIMKGMPPESCSMAGVCSRQLVVEADGSVYPCDFYAIDGWKLGNLASDSLTEIEAARKRLAFIEASELIPAECRQCRWYPLCRNGCRRNCEPVTTQQRGKNYYCNAYREFFEYAYQGLLEILNIWQFQG